MPVFGLIDGNSFFVSCERAFDPRLRGKPVVSLSSNDGCAIARSDEAKALGIKMGEPWHLVKARKECRDVICRSSNFSLFGDMSRRVYDVLAKRVPSVEPYSIDENFLELDGIPDLPAFCASLRDDVRRIAKIPTCVGIGPTKTIAKLGNRVAKKDSSLNGVCDLRDPDERARHYRNLPIGDVWGIGAQTAAKLEQHGVRTIEDFLNMSPKLIREMLTVVGARVQTELRGISCLPLTMMAPTRQGIAVTRSFGRPVETWEDLREAVVTHTTRAAEKLRSERLEVSHLTVFAHTNRFNGDPVYSGHRASKIEPTSDTMDLISEATRLLKIIWRPGFRYSKAGVMLNDLAPAGHQHGLFQARDPIKSAKTMATLDRINERFGRGTLRPASLKKERPTWSARRDNLSPRYTTELSEILVARAY